jgi:hypothetical protein
VRPGVLGEDVEALLLGRRRLRSKPVSDFAAASSSALPLPMYQFGSTWRRFCHSVPTTSAPAVEVRLASSASDS